MGFYCKEGWAPELICNLAVLQKLALRNCLELDIGGKLVLDFLRVHTIWYHMRQSALGPSHEASPSTAQARPGEVTEKTLV